MIIINFFRFNPPDVHILASAVAFSDVSWKAVRDIYIQLFNHKPDVSQWQVWKALVLKGTIAYLQVLGFRGNKKTFRFSDTINFEEKFSISPYNYFSLITFFRFGITVATVFVIVFCLQKTLFYFRFNPTVIILHLGCNATFYGICGELTHTASHLARLF